MPIGLKLVDANSSSSRMRWPKAKLSKDMRKVQSRSGKCPLRLFFRCNADFSGRLINSQSLGQDPLTNELMISDNGTDLYDSSEKQRIPAWTGKWLRY